MELLFGARQAVGASRWAIVGIVTSAVFAAEPQTPSRVKSAAEAEKPRVELTITGPQNAIVGSRVTFELVVINAGGTTAAKLLMVDDFDPGLAHDVAPSPIEHDLKDLPPGQSQRLGVTFRVMRPGRHAHQVQVTQQGKLIAAAKASVLGVEAVPSSETNKRASPAEKPSVELAEPGAKKTEKAKTASSKDSDFTSSAVVPGAAPPKETKMPDLGPPLVERPQDLKRLNERYSVWIDRKQGSVVLVGAVSQRQVPLRLFACVRGSKEHESVLSIPTKAVFVHAALLAVGAEPGAPARFRPDYISARGPEIEITCVWKDAQGNRQTARAQDWVRNSKTRKPLELPWVFGGSRFQNDPATGETRYQADADGDLICVSNSPGAMLDLPIRSSSSDPESVFESFTEHIPPRGTPVTLILTPKSKGLAPK